MNSWPAPELPDVQGEGHNLRIWDAGTGALTTLEPADTATMYVCGITPYDATHLGHAATYVTFDLAGRVLRDAGHPVRYVQNVTDIDDPLLERAERDGVSWEALAHSEIELFHTDMAALRVIPPDHYVGVVETMDRHIASVSALLESGAAYALPVPPGEGGADGAQDVYLDLGRQGTFGAVSRWDRDQMLEVFADRGGDPDRVGKRDVLDPLLWRAKRPGEPSWTGGSVSEGRPGWHIECTTIALDHLGMGFDLQGGGTDLIFPHHEMSAVQAVALTGQKPFAHAYAHQAMVAYDGEKMSKSKGNLVRVSDLRRDGVDPMAIRLVLLAQHYRTEWEYTGDLLDRATARLAAWRLALGEAGDHGAGDLIAQLRAALARDLDAPAAALAVDAWAESAPRNGRPSPQVEAALDALLGIRLAA
ncbi:cysteine--1-D-myo-inosityl 2-amino-2-deoxy-alpha-D-glucopyranoside ligase [Leekyejoonella antrihumi]|uniref:L-cysteine:1D-myo-inositol 2-amino-2-deoxy-alpha-D-glucopyranoside ligase n=1 Tax=Leekyejoonella antrihumi TaxID=1660198 RepID=A0A563DT99_9MICO|nr:cysteine--1-D-myo-inosityl 2-amino-2-deoxy-alpha-D-glucopyranoside ligase [Leekyejoonella antrihumi]TWP33213.1 cysteine--1-D-myo-inosityl 2-amino-2-deoxy-alpha-D-glucopyranoside ligase [Leekyejoonella antrihumi]